MTKNLPPASPIGPRPLTVLVVDDSRLQRRLLQMTLKKWGYVVLEAESGVAALAVFADHRIDIVLSDWMMPGMDGLEFCRQFRALPRDHYGYFILLTSKDDKGEVAQGLDVGADDFLTKPVNSGELLARIRAGERVLGMEAQLVDRNRSVSEALQELRGVYEAIDRDLEEAKKLQMSLLPETEIALKGGSLAMMLQSSGHVGGDMVGTYYRSETRVGLYGFDVSGHGVSSALMTARLAGCLGASNPAHSIAMTQTPDGDFKLKRPSDIAAAMNRRMLEELDTDLYLTMLLAEIDLTTGKAILVQAGHPNPAILRADGHLKYVGTGGLPIGLVPGATYCEFSIHLHPGDRLIVYSDGFTEAADSAGTMLDEAGLALRIEKAASTVGTAFLSGLVAEVLQYSANGEAGDDLSAILFDYHGAQVRHAQGQATQNADPLDLSAAPLHA